MRVTTQPVAFAADTALARPSEASVRRTSGKPAWWAIGLLATILAIVAAVMLNGPFSRWMSRPVMPGQPSSQAPGLRFLFPPETAPDRILLKTGVNVIIAHQDTAPDRISLVPLPGDLIGSFTWTVIPHQGSRSVRRLIGEAEWQGRVFKLCEAIDDPQSSQPRYAERYFPVNNSGVHYRNPQRADAAPFVDFLDTAIAQLPASQQPIGEPPPSRVGAMAERLIPLCTGQGG